tara:strand:- start:22955 stop:23224 length:270 start_codon:yes stop_codon:yes gene_type:complete
MNDVQTPQPQLDIDLSATTAVKSESESNGANIFAQGFILRKVSKFVANTTDDAILPIPVFYEPSSGMILADSIPEALKEEYKDFVIEKE